MASSARYIQVAPLSRAFFDRLLRVAHLSGGNVGLLAYAALRDLCPDLPHLPDIRYKVLPAPMVGGFVVWLYPGREVHAAVDAWLYAINASFDLRDQLRQRLLKKYAAAANDDPQLPLTFNT